MTKEIEVAWQKTFATQFDRQQREKGIIAAGLNNQEKIKYEADKAAFVEEAVADLVREIEEEKNNQVLFAKRLKKFQNVEFFKCTAEENENKIRELHFLAIEEIDLDHEDENGKTILDYPLEAGNICLSMELVSLGAKKYRNVNNSNLITNSTTFENTEYIKTYLANWIAATKNHRKSNQNPSKEKLEKLKEFTIQTLISTLGNDTKKQIIAINASLNQTLPEIQILSKTLLEEIKQKKLLLENEWILKFEKQIATLCASNPKMKSAFLGYKKFILERFDVIFSDLIITLENLNHCFLVNTSVLNVNLESFLGEEIGYHMNLIIFYANQNIERTELLAKRMLQVESVPQTLQTSIETFTTSFYQSIKTKISQIKKIIIGLKFTIDLNHVQQKYFKTSASTPLSPSVGKLACQSLKEELNKEFDYLKTMTKSRLQLQHKKVDAPLLDMLFEHFDTKYGKIKVEILDELNRIFCTTDYNTYDCGLMVFAHFYCLKKVFSITFLEHEIEFNILLDFLTKVSSSAVNMQQKKLLVKQTLESIPEHQVILAADRKRTKELMKSKRDDEKFLLLKQEMEKERALKLQKQEADLKMERKQTQDKLVESIKKLHREEQLLLENILTKSKHPNITDKQLETLFGSDNQPKLLPFSIKPTANGFQICFKMVPIATLDRQHGGGEKGINEKFFNAIRDKFATYGITAKDIQKLPKKTQ